MESLIHSIWSRDYQVATYLVNSHKQLGLYHLLNLLQDTAWEHATHLGHGYQKMIDQNMIWALTRQKLIMNSEVSTWPKWGESVRIKTWIRPTEGLLIQRDFEICALDPNLNETKLGECASSWLTLNWKTRRPVRNELDLASELFRTEGALRFEAKKIGPRDNLKELYQHSVKLSDLDMNAHVNNTNYAQWILNSAPETDRGIKIYEINFLSECNSGDLIGISSDDDRGFFQGVRNSDSKTVFTATVC